MANWINLLHGSVDAVTSTAALYTMELLNWHI
jgi:hypothetical protein